MEQPRRFDLFCKLDSLVITFSLFLYLWPSIGEVIYYMIYNTLENKDATNRTQPAIKLSLNLRTQ